MQMQVEAERKKRAAILESEGVREADINVAEGKKRARILNSEADKTELINKAQGRCSHFSFGTRFYKKITIPLYFFSIYRSGFSDPCNGRSQGQISSGHSRVSSPTGNEESLIWKSD